MSARLAAAPQAERVDALVDYLFGELSRVLKRPADSFARDDHLLDMGLDSVHAVEIFEAIRRDTGIDLAPLAMYEHATIGALGAHLAELAAKPVAAAAPALPARGPGGAVFDQLLEAEGEAAREALFLDLIVTLSAERLAIARESIDVQGTLVTHGLDSVRSMEVFEGVLTGSSLNLPASVLAEHPTFAGLAQRLAVEFALAHPDSPARARDTRRAPNSRVSRERMGRMEGVLEDVRARLESLVPGAVANGGPARGAAVVRDDPTAWVRRHRRPGRPVDLRLLCFHSAGMDATMYDPWAQQMPDGVELCAVRLPGRPPHNGKPVPTMDELLPMLHTALQPFMDGRFAFFGHSFGALTAYAVTRYLRDRGERLPVRLVVAGFWSPDRFVSPAGADRVDGGQGGGRAHGRPEAPGQLVLPAGASRCRFRSPSSPRRATCSCRARTSRAGASRAPPPPTCTSCRAGTSSWSPTRWSSGLSARS